LTFAIFCRIVIKSLEESDDIAVYQEMTFPRYREWLGDFKTGNDLIVIKAKAKIMP
jgi:hypothetical protein